MSLDSDMSLVFDKIKSQNLNSCDHLNVMKEAMCDALYDFDFVSAPWMVIVNKAGEIAKMCVPD